MKKCLLVLSLLLLPFTAMAAEPRTKNLATKLCMFMYDSAGEFKTGDAANMDCELCPFSDGTAPSACTDANGAETESPASSGNYCVSALAAEVNDEFILMKCASSTSGVPSRSKLFYTKHGTVYTNDSGQLGNDTIGPLSGTFDGVTLGEGASTLDLEASEISADNQFRGDRINLYFAATGRRYASSCIVSSTNANERVTTEEDLSSLHNTGDYYKIKDDAGCRVTASKLQADAATEVGAAVLDVPASSHNSAGTIGEKINDGGAGGGSGPRRD